VEQPYSQDKNSASSEPNSDSAYYGNGGILNVAAGGKGDDVLLATARDSITR
jgi:hypothetical protein